MPVTINGTSGLVTATSYAGSGGDLTGITTGKILQVVQTVKTDAFSTTSTSFVDITGLSVDITPSSTNSKILVTATIDAFAQRTNSYNSMSLVLLFKDSTALIGGHMRGRIDNSDTANYFNSGGHVSLKYLDSPSTTSQLTYKVKGVNWAGNSTLFVNNETGNTYYAKSTIIAQEVAA
tara:strand:+ start:67 stop:600 length:534 start_codon:yes stop_codon:yes gene_type:complete